MSLVSSTIHLCRGLERAEVEAEEMGTRDSIGLTVRMTDGVGSHAATFTDSPGALLALLERATIEVRRVAGLRDPLVEVLVQAIEESGYTLSGPTDHRAAVDGESAWVCNARAEIARIYGGLQADPEVREFASSWASIDAACAEVPE